MPAAAFAAAMLAVFLLGPRELMTGDTTHYLAMVRGESAPSPFAYRLLTPAIVAGLPGSPGLGFFLVAYAATFATLWVTYRIFRHLGISARAATVTCVFLCLSYPVANYLSRWGRIDPLANLLFALGLLWILERRFVAASLLVTVGVLGKETILLLLPILFVDRLRSGPVNARSLLAAAGLCLLPIAAFVGVRQTVEVSAGSFTVERIDDVDLVLEQVWAYNVDQFGLSKRIARDLTKSYGFFWAMAALGLWIDRRWRLTCLYLIAAGFGLCLVATDWARMLGTGFPGIFIPVAYVAGRLEESPRWRSWMGGFLALALVQCYVSLLVYRDLPRGEQLAMVAAGAAATLAGAGLAAWAYFSQLRRPTPA